MHRAEADENQLHAAVVELIALDNAEIKYSTVQNWYAGNSEGRGGIYNFVTKRGDFRAQVEDLMDPGRDRLGDHLEISVLHFAWRTSRGEFYSVAFQTGTCWRHRNEDDSSRPQHDEPHHLQGRRCGQIAEYLSRAGLGAPPGDGSAQFHQLRFALIGHECGAHTVPYIEAKNASAVIEHEATTSKVSEEQLFYCLQRGLSAEEATALIVNGFVRDVLQQLPMEFAVEAQKLISISLEGSVG